MQHGATTAGSHHCIPAPCQLPAASCAVAAEVDLVEQFCKFRLALCSSIGELGVRSPTQHPLVQPPLNGVLIVSMFKWFKWLKWLEALVAIARQSQGSQTRERLRAKIMQLARILCVCNVSEPSILHDTHERASLNFGCPPAGQTGRPRPALQGCHGVAPGGEDGLGNKHTHV